MNSSVLSSGSSSASFPTSCLTIGVEINTLEERVDLESRWDVWVAKERVCARSQAVRRWRTAHDLEERSEDDNYVRQVRIENSEHRVRSHQPPLNPIPSSL